MQPTEADNETEEEHLVNFVVNSLDEELAIDLGESIEVTTEKLYELLAGASAGGTLINHVCETIEDSPHANTVRGHLTDQFDLDTVEAVGDTLLRRDALETLPDRPVEIVDERRDKPGNRSYVNRRLTPLAEHGHVRNIRDKDVYELVNDPRTPDQLVEERLTEIMDDRKFAARPERAVALAAVVARLEEVGELPVATAREILGEHGVTFGSRDELLPATLREYDNVEVLDGGKQYHWRGRR